MAFWRSYAHLVWQQKIDNRGLIKVGKIGYMDK